MSEYSAKTLRDKAKARARDLAKTGDYKKDQMVSSADWSPAEPLNTTIKTGARPISPRAYKRGGAVKKATGGEIADAIVKRDTKKAIGSKEHVGGFKKGGTAKRADGGGVLNKKAVGDVQVLPKRGKAENYMCGGKIKKAGGGGSWLEKIVGKPKSGSDLSGVGKGTTSSYSKEDKASLSDIAKGGSGSTLPSDETEFGKSQNYKKGGRTARATGGSATSNPLSTAAKAVGKAAGGARKGKTDIKINIIAGGQKPAMPAGPINLPAPPMPPAPPVAAPPPAAMGAMPGGMPMARKSGGRISKVASSYKDMTAGSGSGNGRLQKTSIEKKGKDAPAKKRGGSVSK